MLFRLVVAAFAVGLGIFLFRAWRLRAARLARVLSAAELAGYQALAARSELLAEALSLRDKARMLEAGRGAAGALDDVDDAVRELAVKVELAERLLRTAQDLEAGATDEALTAARRAMKTAPDDDARGLEEERLALLERQRTSAEELSRRRDDVVRASERIVLGLREVHVALLELQAAGGEAGAGDARARLSEASEELRRRAAAHDEVKAFLEAGGAER